MRRYPFTLAAFGQAAQDSPDMAESSFEEDFAAAKNGGEAAQAVIAEQYSSQIFFYLHAIVRNRSLAEDLTQDTFLKFFRKISVISLQGTLAPYLRSIARNTAREHFRRNSREEVANSAWKHQSTLQEVEKGHGSASLFSDPEMARLLQSRIRQLPAASQKLLEARYFRKMKAEEIARELGYASTNAVRLALGRVRKQLKKDLTQSKELRDWSAN